MKKRPSTYTLMDVMMASPTDPMPLSSRVHQLTRMHQGLHAMIRGDEPRPDDWRVVSDAINIMETMVFRGTMQDEDGLIMKAITAMVGAAERSKSGQALRLDAKGIEVLRGLLEDYQFALENLPHRTMVTCHRETETRIRDIIAGKRKATDVVVASL